MIDKSKIPESTLNELNNLFGEEEAKRIIEKENYNYHAISNKILIEKMKKKFGKRFWIYVWIVALVIAILYHIFWWRI